MHKNENLTYYKISVTIHLTYKFIRGHELIQKKMCLSQTHLFLHKRKSKVVSLATKIILCFLLILGLYYYYCFATIIQLVSK